MESSTYVWSSTRCNYGRGIVECPCKHICYIYFDLWQQLQRPCLLIYAEVRSNACMGTPLGVSKATIAKSLFEIREYICFHCGKPLDTILVKMKSGDIYEYKANRDFWYGSSTHRTYGRLKLNTTRDLYTIKYAYCPHCKKRITGTKKFLVDVYFWSDARSLRVLPSKTFRRSRSLNPTQLAKIRSPRAGEYIRHVIVILSLRP